MTDEVIGFSGFDFFEECYEYCENACFIGDTKKSVERFMRNSFSGTSGYRVDPVTVELIMKDYGCSCGEYAMEQEAFEKFKAIASEKGIRFEARPELGDLSLMIVDVEGVKITDD